MNFPHWTQSTNTLWPLYLPRSPSCILLYVVDKSLVLIFLWVQVIALAFKVLFQSPTYLKRLIRALKAICRSFWAPSCDIRVVGIKNCKEQAHFLCVSRLCDIGPEGTSKPFPPDRVDHNITVAGEEKASLCGPVVC